MNLSFQKYSGAGNDFILVDNRDKIIPYSSQLIAKLCHRHNGIGADGLILLENSLIASSKMLYFNADGSSASLCGNGLRCFAKFIQSLQIIENKGVVEVQNELFSVDVQDKWVTVEMPIPGPINFDVKLEDKYHGHFLNTGVPHFIVFTESVNQIDVLNEGKKLRNHPFFSPDGANINFVQILSTNEIRIRTYERGVENETLACGTGACASSIASVYKKNLQSPIKVYVQSGEYLTFSFDDKESIPQLVKMAGPAEHIFSGSTHVALSLCKSLF